MKLSDYIVEYLIKKEITDVFGYPGGMIAHLMDSFNKYEQFIKAHTNYHEQAAAFAACGYAQSSGKVGVAYATSGPGATNLVTGICHAYFDSVPCVFITGQVNTFESKKDYSIRQRGFQETDIISIVKKVTKYSVYIDKKENIKYHLDKAFFLANEGRPGPVLLDIPMNILRSEIEPQHLKGYTSKFYNADPTNYDAIAKQIKKSKRPCILLGNGVKTANYQKTAKSIVDKIQIPVLTSMIAFDVISDSKWNFGFIGAYGSRCANFIAAKSDLIISIGSRMDIRQVGAFREKFAPDATIIRFDIDKNELSYKVHDNEIDVCCSIGEAFNTISSIIESKNYIEWRFVCKKIREKLKNIDYNGFPNHQISAISQKVPDNAIITTDVGQNQVWIAQSFCLKKNQIFLFSGSFGAMGYSLPAAIGAYYGSNGKPIFCFCGDGGFQMNIQELQYVIREKIPIKIIILNNNSLGMMRHFQEMYFDSNFFQTIPEQGYTSPDFSKIASAYGIKSIKFSDISDLQEDECLYDDQAVVIEICINENTYVFPKLEFGKPNQDQEPLISRELYNEIMDM